MTPLRIGVLGAGAIAAEVTDALAQSERCTVAAVASRSAERAERFAADHGVARSFGSYDALLADAELDVVYVATPHPTHERWAIAATAAGKHVLCEKPLTLNAVTAARVLAEADHAGVAVLEAFAYRFHPQTHRLLELVGDGAIGEVRQISVTFSYAMPGGDDTRLVRRDLGGGGILDVGCYCTAMCADVVAAARHVAVAELDDVAGMAVLHPGEGTDLRATAILRFDGDILAQVACGVDLVQQDHVRVFGTAGSLLIDSPCWLGGRREAGSTIELVRHGDSRERIDVPPTTHIFALEADGLAALIDAGPDAWRATWGPTIANLRTLDRWRAAVGVRYDGEQG